ncbi:MAG: glycosyltransferase family 87 protein [Nitrospiraceae bacterium]
MNAAFAPSPHIPAPQWKFLAIGLWGAVLVLSTTIYILDPVHNVVGVYHDATQAWLANQDPYLTPRLFNYAPQFTMLFSPFYLMGRFVGDLLWRWISLALLVGAWWRLAKLCNGRNAWKAFFWSSLLGMAACGDAIRNGQANVILAAFLLWSTCFLIERRWWWASGSLVLGLTKPLGVIMIGLAMVTFPVLIPQLLTVLLGFMLLPFCCDPPEYVVSLFVRFVENLMQCSAVTEHRFADINGLFRSIGWEIPFGWSQGIRVVAGLCVLGLCLRNFGRLREPMRAMVLLSITTTYLMLFNPMNEVNTYILMVPGCGLLAAYFYDQHGGRGVAYTLYGVVVTIGILPELARRVTKTFGLWWDPLMALVFLGVVFWLMLRENSKEGVNALDGPVSMSSPT